jgi:predicted aspartyl protease
MGARVRVGLAIISCGMLLAHAAMAACGIRHEATLPLLSGERPVAQVAINGQFAQMLIDSGSQTSMVTPNAVTALRLPRDPRHASRILTVGGEEVSRNAILASLDVAGLRFETLSVAVSPLDGTRTDTGTEPAGLIGGDLLHNFDLELDIPGRTLTLYRPDGCAPSRPAWNGPFDHVPATVSGRNQVMFDVLLSGKAVRAMFDTGSRGETVSRDAANALGITDAELQRDPAASGVSGGQHGYRIRRHSFATMQIGSEQFRNLPLDVVDFHQPGIDMLVGVDYMRTRRFFVSYSAGALFIQKVPPTSDAHAPAVALGHEGCRVPSDLVTSLSRAPLVVVSQPRVDPPAAARAARVTGCVGVLFRLTPQGVPRDMKVVAEEPTGFGLGAFAMQEVAAARFEPSPDTGWHYDLRRVDLSAAP